MELPAHLLLVYDSDMNDQELGDVLAKYRDEVAPSLSFQPSISHLMDSPYCKSVDRLLHQSLRWERRTAVDTLGPSLPSVTGLYMFVWRPVLTIRFAAEPAVEQPFWVLYIGKAGRECATHDTIRDRYVSEYKLYVGKDPSCLWENRQPTTRSSRLALFLTLRPLEFWFLELTNVRDIAILEKKLIKLLRPPLNYQHGAVVRPGKPVPAFEDPK